MKDAFELTHNKDVDMRKCIEVINRVKNMVGEIKIDLLNENKDVDCFIIIDSIYKSLTQAAYHAEQLDWELLKRKE